MTMLKAGKIGRVLKEERLTRRWMLPAVFQRSATKDRTAMGQAATSSRR